MPTIKLGMNRAALVSSIESWTNYPAGPTFRTDWEDPLKLEAVFGFSDYPDQIKFFAITNFELYVYANSATIYPNPVSFSSLGEPFNEDAVTYDSLGTFSELTSVPVSYGYTTPCWISRSIADPSALRTKRINDAIKNGVRVISRDITISTPASSNQPYVVFTYGGDPVGLSVKQTYPTGAATISKSIKTTFTWDATPENVATLEPVLPASAVLRWRYSGASSYEEVSCDSPTSHTIPANTFNEGVIQWQVVVTANSGVITTSDWMTTEVKEPTSTSLATHPINTVLDGSAEQIFSWEHIISNGTAQYAFDLQTSPDGSEWATIKHVESAQTSTKFAAGTFTAGDLWWRVRTYNLVGTPGAWSDPVHCIVIAAPAAPSITADDNSPRFVLRWQQSGQQAYELMVDGVIIAKTFSAESIYRHSGYLEPGEHRVQVRIQNRYQMWSEWGTANLQIENVEGAPILLTASGENEVALNWSTSGVYESYIIYRAGVKIAETANTSYVDHFAVGKVEYQVRGVYSDSGYYTLSDKVDVVISPKTILIADVLTPEWIELSLSTSSIRSSGLSASHSVTYTHYIGNALPGAEIGDSVSRSYNLSCAFKASDLETIRKFEALLGKVVCIKTPSQRRIVGVLSQLSATENRFYVAYNVPIAEVRWEEFQE